MHPLHALLLAQQGGNQWIFVVACIALLVVLVFLLIFFSFLKVWIQAQLTGARVSMMELIGMRLRKVDYRLLVQQKIALVQAGVHVETRDLEAHYLAGGKLPRTANAVIAAHKRGLDLPWATAAAADLAGDAMFHGVCERILGTTNPDSGR